MYLGGHQSLYEERGFLTLNLTLFGFSGRMKHGQFTSMTLQSGLLYSRLMWRPRDRWTALCSLWAEPFSAQKTFACSAPGVWTGTFPLLNMEVAYGKEHGENSTSNQNTSVFKYSELYRAGIKVKMGKLEVSACRTFLHHGLATLRERFGGLFSMPVCNWSMLLCHP